MFNDQNIMHKINAAVKTLKTVEISGRVTRVVGIALESDGPKAKVGELCYLRDRSGKVVNMTEVVGFKEGNKIISMVLGEMNDIGPGMEIIATGSMLSVKVGDNLLGRVLDGLGEPIDGLGPIKITERRSIYAQPPNPLHRKRIVEPMATGIRAIDGMLTFGRGQRVGVFAGSGVGKSTAIGMIARNSDADVNVIALIGERGREVKEFIEKDLGPEGLARSVVIVATGDTPPLVRVKSALVATTIAEYFRDRNMDVMLMMDSVTRLAMAQREVGLTVGEPPTTKGYTPSVFTIMQKTMERAGASDKGGITALYTVLVEGDDMNEPIADAARGILDGHVVLSRKLAALGHYPAIDILESISRVRGDVVSEKHLAASRKIQELMAIYKSAEDLISVGAYQRGSNLKLDKAVELIDEINSFLKQRVEDSTSYDNTVERIINLATHGIAAPVQYAGR